MWAFHKPRKFQFREIQNSEIQEVAVFSFVYAYLPNIPPAHICFSLSTL